MSAVFMTATGTDIGKTHVGAAYLRHRRERGEMPFAVKPLMSGYDPSRLEESDAGRLLAACGLDATEANVNAVCMKRFPDPLSPNVAARQSGVPLDYDDILAFVNSRLLLNDGPGLVEGAGGVMSPVTDNWTHADLISDLAMPCFLVTASYLGAVSHTLTALESLSRRSVPVLAVIVSQPSADAGAPTPLVDELARWTDLPLLAAPFARRPADLEPLAVEMSRLAR